MLGGIFVSIEPWEGYFSYNQSDFGDVSTSYHSNIGVWTLMLVLGEIFMSIEPWDGYFSEQVFGMLQRVEANHKLTNTL